jgi:alpha-L-fucosidase
LLDIGPAADGTIPVVMEERLIQIGDWLKVNGEAIYGTRPWKTAKQWSTGDVAKVDYNKEFQSAYDVTKMVGKPSEGKAAIEAFFTSKGQDVYAILPRWPGRSFEVKDVTGVRRVTLLGSGAPLTFRAVRGGVSVALPEVPEGLMSEAAWVLKLSR